MNVLFWTLVGFISVLVLPSLNYAFTWKRGPLLIRRLGSFLFRGMKRTMILYILLISLIFWTAMSYLSGFRLGLGVGITSEVGFPYLMNAIAEWVFIILMYIVVIAGMYRHPSFHWVFPPYSDRLATVWIIRARVWNRSADSFKRFLLDYYEKVENSEYQYYKKAIEKISSRTDWIGNVAKDVSSNKFGGE